jgi:hypothetical protein
MACRRFQNMDNNTDAVDSAELSPAPGTSRLQFGHVLSRSSHSSMQPRQNMWSQGRMTPSSRAARQMEQLWFAFSAMSAAVTARPYPWYNRAGSRCYNGSTTTARATHATQRKRTKSSLQMLRACFVSVLHCNTNSPTCDDNHHGTTINKRDNYDRCTAQPGVLP